MGSTLVRTVASTPDEYAAVVARYLGGTHFVFDRKAFSDHDAILSLNWEMDEQDMLAVLRLPYLLAEERPERMFLIVEEFQSLDLADDGVIIFLIPSSEAWAVFILMTFTPALNNWRMKSTSQRRSLTEATILVCFIP